MNNKHWSLAVAAVFLKCGLLGLPAHAITVQQVRSPSGINAYLVEDHTTPVVAISFGFSGGSALDPVEKLGLSNLAASLLDEGAGDLDSFTFQSELEDYAISIRYNVDPDMTRGQLTTTSAHIGRGIELTQLTLTQPRFDEEPLERIRRQILAFLANRLERPGYIASRKLVEELYGDHPYSRSSDGTPSSIVKITQVDLLNWVKLRFARDRLIIGAAGDITPEHLGLAIDQIFGGLPESSGLNSILSEAEISAEGRTVHVTKNLPQTIIYIGQPGIKREDPDWYAATVVDYVLGGGSFASRLMDEVREKRGLAYSVSSNLVPYDAGGIITAAVGTRTEQASESLKIMREEWDKMRKSGPTDDEVADAKRYLTGAWPLRFTSTSSIANILLAVQRDNLGPNYLDKRNNFVESVTAKDARRVAHDLYDRDALTVVIVGPENVDEPAVPN